MHGYYVIVAYNGPHNEFNSNFNEETKAGLSSFFCQARLFYNFIIFEPLLCEVYSLFSLPYCYLFLWELNFENGTRKFGRLEFHDMAKEIQ